MHLFHGNAVIEVSHGFIEDGLSLDVCIQARASCFNQSTQSRHVEHHAFAAVNHMQDGFSGKRLLLLGCTFLGSSFAVQNIGARNCMVAAAHEAELDLVLYVFNMEGAATWA